MNHFIKLFAVSAIGLSFVGTAQAAGYQLNEYSATGMGRSFAGMGVVGDDFSAIGYNPAGMSLNKTSGAQLNASLVHIYSRFKGASNQFDPAGTYGRGHTNVYRLVPGAFAQYKMNEDLTLGVGFYTPFGLATDYPNGWFAESHGGLSEITAMDFSPSLAYRVNNYLSVGASVNVQYTDAHLTSAASDISGDDTGVGYSLGLTVKPLENLRFGISYRSKISHKLKGDVDRLTLMGNNFTGSVDAKITTPETAILSGAWDVNEKWTLSGTARWTRWKRFNVLDINLHTGAPGSYANLTSSTQEKWRNTGFYALGADYHINPSWTVRGGIAYDMTVIRSAGHRTARIPDGRRVWNSLGASYSHKNWQLDFGYSHIFVFGGHAKGADSLNPKPDIKYSSNADMFSLGIQYKF